jgi:hypothetical protein
MSDLGERRYTDRVLSSYPVSVSGLSLEGGGALARGEIVERRTVWHSAVTTTWP